MPPTTVYAGLLFIWCVFSLYPLFAIYARLVSRCVLREITCFTHASATDAKGGQDGGVRQVPGQLAARPVWDCLAGSLVACLPLPSAPRTDKHLPFYRAVDARAVRPRQLDHRLPLPGRRAWRAEKQIRLVFTAPCRLRGVFCKQIRTLLPATRAALTYRRALGRCCGGQPAPVDGGCRAINRHGGAWQW